MAERKILGIIAGGGQFPLMVARGAREMGYTVTAVAFEKETLPEISRDVDNILWIRLGQLGRLIRFLKKENVSQVVFAGPVNKPRAFDMRPDLRAIKLLLGLKSRNDNSLLSAVANELSSENLNVVSALNFVPGLVSPSGLLTRRGPSGPETEDIKFGWPVVKQIGSMDIGQCIAVREKAVIAVEAIEGTDEMIRRAGRLVGKKFTIIKTFKPGQDSRIDLPALGLGTIETMVESGASCLAYEAGMSLFFELEKAVKLADKNKMVIRGIDPERDFP